MDYQKEITAFVLNDELSKTAMETIENALISDESDENKIDAIENAIITQPAEYGIDKMGYASEFDCIFIMRTKLNLTNRDDDYEE